ncbi:MAG TPA: FAD-dependent monooxygenase, partial [Pseudonocardiaceae bacterium]|nr:FAD-dependent monooxygenase [Pseudonocardiaceae bacterium]
MDAYDVVVAGGGPVGLMVAAELGLRGVSVAVLERLAEPSTTIKAGGLNTTTVDAFDRRGLLPELTAAHRAMVSRFMTGGGAPPPPGASRPKIGGHFAGMFGMDPARVDPSDPDFRTGPGSLVSLVPQPEVERILAQWVARLGIPVRRGVEITGLAQDDTGVTVE